jgi:CRISPR-associated protein Cas1
VNHYLRLTSLPALYAGWERVAANDGGPGVDRVSINKFDVALDRDLERLHRELVSFTYRCMPLRRYEIPKLNGKIRTLAVPTVRDRVVQSSALIVLQPVIERELERCSFAYRPGLSRLTAIEQIRQLREQGYRWVVDADIESFFDNVEFGLLLRRFRELVPENHTVALIEQWLKAPVLFHGRLIKRTKGLPQGSPISPVLANLFLDKFDEALLAHNHKLIRYADDFIILCKTKPRAEEALRLTEELLAGLHLRLNAEKTAVTSFDQGFKYLGAIFVKSIIIPQSGTKPQRRKKQMNAQSPDPPLRQNEKRRKSAAAKKKEEITVLAQALLEALNAKQMTTADLVRTPPTRPPVPNGAPEPPSAPPNVSPFMRTLYIQEQGCWLRLDGERFVVATGGEEGVALYEIPTVKVEQIMIFGTCLITPAAMRYALLHTIPITLLSSRGQYFGRIESTYGADITLERTQFLHSVDTAFVLQTARTIVQAKLRNTKALLQRHQTKHEMISAAIVQLTRLEDQVANATSVDQVRGYEGSGSAVFFDVFDELMPGKGFTFEKRTRRPPTDPVNAMLSFGYTLLFNNIYSMARLHRLNPYVGSLHAALSEHKQALTCSY